jgi:hypothetical protein
MTQIFLGSWETIWWFLGCAAVIGRCGGYLDVWWLLGDVVVLGKYGGSKRDVVSQ